jgi:hypothetical protein
LATTNEPVRVPSSIEQVGELTGVPDNEQLVSSPEKSAPETLIVVPNGPEFESNEIEGLGARLVVSFVLVAVEVEFDSSVLVRVDVVVVLARACVELVILVDVPVEVV